jgi:hypothetical protein
MAINKSWKIGIVISLLALLLSGCGGEPLQETVIVEQTVTKEVEIEVVVTNTPELIPPTSEPIIIFEDNFENESSGWSTLDKEDAKRHYENGQYIISGNKAVWGHNPELERTEDFTLDVDFIFVKEEGTAGIMFRYLDDDNFYLLQIYELNGEGGYALSERVNGDQEIIAGASFADAIEVGMGASNHIRLEVSGPRIAAYVNDELLVYIIDDSFRSGSIELFADRFISDDPYEIAFDNLVVTSPN